MWSKAKIGGLIWAAYFITLGFGMLAAGLLFPPVDPFYIYIGGLVFALGFVILFIARNLWRRKVFWLFVIAWWLGTFVNGFLFHDAGLSYMLGHHLQLGYDSSWMRILGFLEILLIMFSTMAILGPLLLVTYWLSERYARRLRFRIWLLLFAAFVLSLILPRFTCFFITKPYPQTPDKIEVTDDKIEGNQPLFIDDPEMWAEQKISGRGGFRQRINKSSAVIGLDLGEVENNKTHITEKLFPTYQEAMDFARGRNLPVIPSFQMIDHKSKVFADTLYAAVDRFMQDSKEAPGGGKAVFLGLLLNALLNTEISAVAKPCSLDSFSTHCSTPRSLPMLCRKPRHMLLREYGLGVDRCHACPRAPTSYPKPWPGNS